jgi:hypothetical protein
MVDVKQVKDTLTGVEVKADAWWQVATKAVGSHPKAALAVFIVVVVLAIWLL